MIKKHIMEHSFVKREKRIFTINVGTLPPEQVEAYVRRIQESFKTRLFMFNNTDPI